MIYIILGEGFEEVEAIAACDVLRRARLPVQMAGIGGKTVAGAHGIKVEADVCVEEMQLSDMEMIVLPGGLGVLHPLRAASLPWMRWNMH